MNKVYLKVVQKIEEYMVFYNNLNRRRNIVCMVEAQLTFINDYILLNLEKDY